MTVTREHGTYSAYTGSGGRSAVGGCSCVRCLEAKRKHEAELRDRNRGTLAVGDRRHGTSHGFDHFGCRCDPCVKAKRARSNDYDRRRRATRAAAT